tara:strand:- start:271 stop:483 length:213 start_codon:yes stop_codon:yes gene_type:complete
MYFKNWICQYFEDSSVGDRGIPEPEDNGLHRQQKLKPDKHYSALATDLFVTKDPKKQKKLKAKAKEEMLS